MKGSFLGGTVQGNLMAVSSFLFDEFSSHFTPSTVCALLKSSTIFFCDQSVITGTLFVEQRIFTAVSRLDSMDFPKTPPLSLLEHSLQKSLN